MRKPRIGINCGVEGEDDRPYYKLNLSYVEAVRKAGGYPVLIPILPDADSVEDFLNTVDGILLTGGDDISPERLGVEDYPGYNRIHPGKETSDFLLAVATLIRPVPTLGVCYGAQLLNVAAGGNLVLDIPSEIRNPKEHGQHDGEMASHKLEVEPGSLLSRISGTKYTVNSAHHQSIKNAGQGFIVSGICDDGVIEAIERPDRDFLVGVQWHPELMDAEDTGHQVIPRLIDACKTRMSAGSDS